MPADFDNILDGIKKSMKGKTNPKTKKPYSDSDLYAIATVAYKKKFGKNPSETIKKVVKENVRINLDADVEVL